MKFLVDQNLSALVAAGLREVGHDAVHTGDLGLQQASDTVVLAKASHEAALSSLPTRTSGRSWPAAGADGPSVVLVRRPSERPAREVLALILANLDAAADALADGAIVVLEAERVRVRRLPLY